MSEAIEGLLVYWGYLISALVGVRWRIENNNGPSRLSSSGSLDPECLIPTTRVAELLLDHQSYSDLHRGSQPIRSFSTARVQQPNLARFFYFFLVVPRREN